MRKPNRILVKRVDNLGDVIFILPILRELRKKYPAAEIVLMVKKEHREVLFNYADKYLPPRTNKWVMLHAKEFSKVFIIAYEVPADYRPVSLGRRRIHHVGVTKFKGPQPVYHKLLGNLRKHELDVSYRPPKIFVNPLYTSRVNKWQITAGLPAYNERLKIVLDPGSSFHKKCWPLSYFEIICKWLINNFNAQLFIVGADNDKRIKVLMQTLKPANATSVTGKSIGFVIALMKQCHLHIGNDSGLGHVAAALNVPTVTIFGPTAPHLWRPAGNKAITVYNPDIECEGGYEHAATCILQKCLYTVKPKSVADAVLASINLFIRNDIEPIFDTVKVSRHFHISKSRNGVKLSNSKTGHSCLVLRGWDSIKHILQSLNESSSLSETLVSFPGEQALLHMLMVHRIVVPAASKEISPFL
jgi:heptosyltransferase-3